MIGWLGRTLSRPGYWWIAAPALAVATAATVDLFRYTSRLSEPDRIDQLESVLAHVRPLLRGEQLIGYAGPVSAIKERQVTQYVLAPYVLTTDLSRHPKFVVVYQSESEPRPPALPAGYRLAARLDQGFSVYTR